MASACLRHALHSLPVVSHPCRRHPRRDRAQGPLSTASGQATAAGGECGSEKGDRDVARDASAGLVIALHTAANRWLPAGLLRCGDRVFSSSSSARATARECKLRPAKRLHEFEYSTALADPGLSRVALHSSQPRGGNRTHIRMKTFTESFDRPPQLASVSFIPSVLVYHQHRQPPRARMQPQLRPHCPAVAEPTRSDGTWWV